MTTVECTLEARRVLDMCAMIRKFEGCGGTVPENAAASSRMDAMLSCVSGSTENHNLQAASSGYGYLYIYILHIYTTL